MIEYKVLNKEEISKVKEIDRSDVAPGIYKVLDGNLIIENNQFIHPGFNEENFERVVRELTTDVEMGGVFIGAFSKDRLVGISGFQSELIGNEKNMLNFGPLWIDKYHRRMGIAKKLVNLSIEKAKDFGVNKFYISATPSSNTISFYLSQGCRLIETPDERLFKKEPDDIHLELVFK
ncbi:GNAT family N-acetyltransferase [Mycoplasmatota bacterium]|nr:GNAT family N-acetyltransferase [Mycoplasmatota bacterium]